MMPTRRQLLRTGGAVLLAAIPPGGALGQAGPAWAAAFVKRLGDEMATIMAGADTPQDRRRRLQPFIDRVADVDGMGRFCLGRFWRLATPAQQREYLLLFHAVLMNAVLSRLGDYQHNEVHVVIDRPEMRDGVIQVPTTVERSGNPPVRVVWVVNDDATDPRLIDVIAEGTSLRITVRSDYGSFLVRHGENIAALIDALRQQACDDCVPPPRPGGP
jgi:phospholipid transport system substrate-binding protein